jgi:hypothetical protein
MPGPPLVSPRLPQEARPSWFNAPTAPRGSTRPMNHHPRVTIDAFLAKLASDMRPGAPADFARLFTRAGRGDGDTIGRMVAFLVTDPDAKRYLKPGVPFKLPDESLLHAVLRRMPLARSADVDRLAVEWRYPTAFLGSPARIAAHVVEALDHPASHQYLDPAVVPTAPASGRKATPARPARKAR